MKKKESPLRQVTLVRATQKRHRKDESGYLREKHRFGILAVLIRVDKRSEHREVFEVGAGVVVRGFEDEGSVFQLWVTRDTAQGFGADVTLADVPVAIDAGVVNGARVVEVNGADVLDSHGLLHPLNQRSETIFLADVMTGSKGVRRVEANAERDFRTQLHDQGEMFEAVADAVALPGGVFQQDAQAYETQTDFNPLQLPRESRGGRRCDVAKIS